MPVKVIALARATGRPIVPMACAYSRRKVLTSTWDKTTIPLPFGRFSVVAGHPIYVETYSCENDMDIERRALDEALNAVTEQAYAQVDGQAHS